MLECDSLVMYFVQVKELQRRSLIYESSHSLEMHDLYIEFAKSLVMKEGSKEREWWVHCKNLAVRMNFESTKRLYLDGLGETMILPFAEQLQRYDKLECLMLSCSRAPQNFTFDVRHLRSLRVLIVHDIKNMKEIVCNCEGEDNDFAELEIVIF